MHRLIHICLIALLALLLAPVQPQAQISGTGLPLPRYVSLRATEVNMRNGPGIQYPVEWVYHRQHLPMEIIAEYGTWRKIRDWQGNQGWIHQSLLSGRRTLIVTGEERTLRREPDSKSLPVARAEVDAVGRLIRCGEGSGWCQVEFGKHSGWLRRVEFWGVYRNELIE